MAVAACNNERQIIAKTEVYPAGLDCVAEEPHFLRVRGVELHLSAFPFMVGDKQLGVISLLHDPQYVADRIMSARRFLLLVFGAVTLLAAVFTIIVARLVWREWSEEMRLALIGQTPRRDFQPLLREVRLLIQRIGTEHQEDVQEGNWTPARLRHTLTRHLHGERIVILANREPYLHERAGRGGISVVHPASGLVTALEPVMRACSGTWVAHGSGSADRETVDSRDRVRVPPGNESYCIRRVWLTKDEEAGYYYRTA